MDGIKFKFEVILSLYLYLSGDTYLGDGTADRHEILHDGHALGGGVLHILTAPSGVFREAMVRLPPPS